MNKNYIKEEALTMIEVCNIRKSFDLHNGWSILFGTRPPMKSISKLVGFSKVKHYGNPFRTTDMVKQLNKKYDSNYKGYGTVEEVSHNFVEWIKGKYEPNIEPERREWILSNIMEGRLKNMKFTYYRDCETETSHILELCMFIITTKISMEKLLTHSKITKEQRLKYITGTSEEREKLEIVFESYGNDTKRW